MGIHDDLADLLKRLRLPGVQDALQGRLDQASQDGLSHLEFLYRLLSDEVVRRENAQIQRRLRRAGFEQEKALEDLDFSFNPQLPKSQILDLGTCRFVKERQNVLLIGPAGTGKSHVAQGIGHRACRAGHTVLYRSTSRLLDELRAARADASQARALARLAKPDLLIVDDVGLLPLRREEPVDLFEVIRSRYERGSLLMTSNRAVKEWYPLFRDPLLASAALDRLLHHATVLTLEGDSFRNPPAGSAA